MSSKNRRKFSRFVKVLHKLGIFTGILTFTFDKFGNRVKRSKTLECYSFFFILLMISFVAILFIKASFLISDVVLSVVNWLQMFSQIVNWIVTLITLVCNRQRIVELVNGGLKIEEDFRHQYSLKPWDSHFIFLFYIKDIIFTTGNIYFLISARRNFGFFFYCYGIVSSVIIGISVVFLENLKIISFFHVSHLLGVLNKSLSRKRGTVDVESIRKISKMYERLLTLAENISKLLKIRTTIVLVCCLITTSTEV
jgi:hypothetical protein